MNTAIDLCLTAAPGADECESVERWWPAHQAIAARWPLPIDASIAAGFAADRPGWAFASGYQVSLRALVPDLPSDRVAAFCVTEEAGNRPKDLRTTITEDDSGSLLVSGAKKWSTLGPESALLLVAGVRGNGARPEVRIARVPADTPGVRVEPMPPTRFIPEVPHARIVLDAVRLPAGALLPGDGHDRYVKPMRVFEDIHVTAALLGYLVREARRRDWPRDWTTNAVAALATLGQVAQRDPTDAVTHVLLGGALNATRPLFEQANGHWDAGPDDLSAQRWRRDAVLVGMSGAVREQRLARAWERLAR